MGSYDIALRLLFEDDLVDGLNAQYLSRWTSCIMRVLWLRARRRGDRFAMRHYKKTDPDVEADVDGADEASRRKTQKRAAEKPEVQDSGSQLDEPSAKRKLLSQLREARTLFVSQTRSSHVTCLARNSFHSLRARFPRRLWPNPF